ncbi:hypothetical protein DFO77_11097 [Marinilabilia salmonicolor]|uniref:Uncharacterized protein n=1 Tax=Marinilabilia salmonicolor TaxID=989 RepID=A0A2T0XEV0_9BACT|nr:hypothetical protein BY457_112125 [Marinilabilia salmonicolor]RCW35330.1 hypothetical protein DFO77_11097 [Marinilabilia salmonicolor]
MLLYGQTLINGPTKLDGFRQQDMSDKLGINFRSNQSLERGDPKLDIDA